MYDSREFRIKEICSRYDISQGTLYKSKKSRKRSLRYSLIRKIPIGIILKKQKIYIIKEMPWIAVKLFRAFLIIG
jgi:hypothetical protein